MLEAIDTELASEVAKALMARGQTVAVSELSSGGLISAALLSVPGASSFFLGGGIAYAAQAREALFGITPQMAIGVRSTTEQMASLLAHSARTRLNADWGLAETGAAGPADNSFGGTVGQCCIAVSGPKEINRLLVTNSANRVSNMSAFANAALLLLKEALQSQ